MTDYFETRPLDDLIPLIAFHYEEMAEGVMKFYLREAAIQFARRSRILRRFIKLDGQKGVNDYILTLDDGYVISEIRQVKVDGKCLNTLCSQCECQAMHYRYRAGQLIICEFEGCEIEVEAIVLPSRDSCTLDADIVDQYGDVIAHGANSVLMTGNDKRWKNIGQANTERLDFERGIEEAQLAVNRGFITPKVTHVKTASDFSKHYKITG